MDRRAFLKWVGVGWLAKSLPLAIVACSAQTTQSSQQSQSTSPGGYQAVGSVAGLNHSGQLLNKQSAVGPVLLFRVSSNNVSAVNPTCPHAGCTVAWVAEQKKFHCPCHGAEFGTHGEVLKGPARKPLKTYAVKLESNSVLVKQS